MNEILSKVKENPQFYLGNPWLTLLKVFVSGYLTCKEQINGQSALAFYPGFGEYIMQKVEMDTSTVHSSFDLILLLTTTEDGAFNTFFKSLDEFKQEKNYKENELRTDICLSEDEAMNIIDEIISSVRKRPRFYLYSPYLERLNIFINGCMAYINEINGEDTFEFYPGFQEFVAKKYEIKIPAHWSKIIIFVSDSEEEALYKFFELLDEYKESVN